MVEIAYGDAMEAEQAGFADFFRADYETLLRAIYLISGSRDEAEELAQDAFVKACERWDRVREMENPAGYLYRTAVNKRRSVARRLRLAAQRALSLRPPDVIARVTIAIRSAEPSRCCQKASVRRSSWSSGSV
jgi:DNA-directed RNA polymerase specialized sigma24 family protein